MNTDRDASLRHGLDYVIEALDAVVQAALDPNYRDEVAAEEIRLRQIIGRVELTLRLLEATRPVKIERAN